MTDADDLAYFCGGPIDGTVMTITELVKAAPSTITLYKWSDGWVKAPPHFFKTRIWEFESDHKHTNTGADMSGPNIHEQLWNELDAAYHKFNHDDTLTSEQSAGMKTYMRGLAFAIALHSAPWFTTADEIVQECHKRYVASFDPESDYCTPGVGARRLEVPQGSKFTRVRKSSEPVQAAKHNLTDAQVEALKEARASGMFSDADLKEMYKLTDVQLRSL